MKKVLVIGAGGVATVTVHKLAMLGDSAPDIVIASRTLSKCDKIADSVFKRTGQDIVTEQVDANNRVALLNLMKKHKPSTVINLALPYNDLDIMNACFHAQVDYIDTANFEDPKKLGFSYKRQWDFNASYKEQGLRAILGSGFDPGVTNVFIAYAQKYMFDTIETIDIIDCNAGDHGMAFAPNFNPEVNIREITQEGKYYKDGEWVTTKPMEHSTHISFPEVGIAKAYLLYHEELESLSKHIEGVQQIRFWMTFSDSYLNHLKVLQNVGMTSIEPTQYKGVDVAPLEFLSHILPKAGDLAENYTGKTCIGCNITGVKDGRRFTKLIYNVCDHEEAFAEVGAHAVAYTTGVGAMVGAMVLDKTRNKPENDSEPFIPAGVHNMEELDPDLFMEYLRDHGLPWYIIDNNEFGSLYHQPETGKSKWLYAQEVLPLCSESGEWAALRSDQVVIETKDGNIYIARLYQGYVDGSSFSDWEEAGGCTIDSEVVRWYALPS